MRALRNPVVIGILVVLALVLGYSRFRPKPVVAPPPVAKQARPQIAGPDASMDLNQLGWTTSPNRDPFRSAEVVAPTISASEDDPQAEPLTDALDLRAVWLQESGGWAVINGKVLAEGDSILDFRVEKILADGVLVQGPDGRRQVNFKPASAKPRPPAEGAAPALAKASSEPTPGNPVTRIPGVPLKLTPSAPLTMDDVTKAVGQVFGTGSTAVTGRPKDPEKSSR